MNILQQILIQLRLIRVIHLKRIKIPHFIQNIRIFILRQIRNQPWLLMYRNPRRTLHQLHLHRHSSQRFLQPCHFILLIHQLSFQPCIVFFKLSLNLVEILRSFRSLFGFAEVFLAFSVYFRPTVFQELLDEICAGCEKLGVFVLLDSPCSNRRSV